MHICALDFVSALKALETKVQRTRIKAHPCACYPRSPMLKNFMAGVWRRLPTGLRRLTIRLTNTKFTVTSAAVIFNKEGKVLLLKHRFRPGSGWGLPGGFLKSDEQPLDGLQRELREEIALELDQVEILWARSFKRPRQIEIILRATTRNEPSLQSIEVESALWFTCESLPPGLPKDQKSLVERAVEKRRV